MFKNTLKGLKIKLVVKKVFKETSVCSLLILFSFILSANKNEALKKDVFLQLTASFVDSTLAGMKIETF